MKRKHHLDEAMAKKIASEVERKFRNKEAYLSPNEIADLTGLTGEAIKQWIYRRCLPAIKMSNGYWKVKVADLHSYLTSKYQIRSKVILFDCKRLEPICTSAGLEVVLSSTYADAVLKAISSVPSLVIVDAQSPNAFKFMQRIRHEKTMMHCPLMVIGDLTDKQTEMAVSLRVQCTTKTTQGAEAEIKRILGL